MCRTARHAGLFQFYPPKQNNYGERGRQALRGGEGGVSWRPAYNSQHAPRGPYRGCCAAHGLQLPEGTAWPIQRLLVPRMDGLQLPEGTARANGTALRRGEADYNSQHAPRGAAEATALLMAMTTTPSVPLGPMTAAPFSRAGAARGQCCEEEEEAAMALNKNHSEGGGVIVNNSEK